MRVKAWGKQLNIGHETPYSERKEYLELIPHQPRPIALDLRGNRRLRRERR